MHDHAPPGASDGGSGRLERQPGVVALLAQVQQDQVLQGPASRPLEHRLDQLGPLPVGEMAAIAEVPPDQDPGTPGGLLHRHVVVELDAEHVDVRQDLGHPLGPAPRIGEVADADRPGPAVPGDLDPEAERRAAVVS
jgi:hypothetical protein